MSALATHAKMVPTALTVSTATLVLVHLDLVASTVKSTHLIARKALASMVALVSMASTHSPAAVRLALPGSTANMI